MRSVTFTITKAKQPMIAKGKTKKVKAKTLKKKKVIVKNSIAVRNAKGKVRYKNPASRDLGFCAPAASATM